MQIDGNYHSNYHSYSRSDYQYASYTNEEAEETRAEERRKEDGYVRSGKSRSENGGVILELSGTVTENNKVPEQEAQASETLLKKGLNLIQDFWESLEETDTEAENEVPEAPISEENGEIDDEVLEETGVQRGISTVLSGIKQFFDVRIADRITALGERLKVGLQTALKRFGKDSETFSALTDPGTGSLFGGRTGGEGKGKRRGNGQEQDVDVKPSSKINEHLMDSYGKNGKYCKINENLTYQQGRAPYKVSEKTAGTQREDSF